MTLVVTMLEIRRFNTATYKTETQNVLQTRTAPTVNNVDITAENSGRRRTVPSPLPIVTKGAAELDTFRMRHYCGESNIHIPPFGSLKTILEVVPDTNLNVCGKLKLSKPVI